jgi:hypothetical protein
MVPFLVWSPGPQTAEQALHFDHHTSQSVEGVHRSLSGGGRLLEKVTPHRVWNVLYFQLNIIATVLAFLLKGIRKFIGYTESGPVWPRPTYGSEWIGVVVIICPTPQIYI